jgi:hypothetical protein
MVKTKPFPIAGAASPGRGPLSAGALMLAAAACALALIGCLPGRGSIDVRPESLSIPCAAPGPRVSLSLCGGTLLAVYADKSTTTLDAVEVPVAAHLPEQAPPGSVIDRIDTAPPLAPRFGEHVLASDAGSAAVLYLDRESESKTVLKAAVRQASSPGWYLDILGDGIPVAVVQAGGGSFDAFWSSGALLGRRLLSAADPATVREPFAADAPGCPAGAGSFTAFDAGSRTLFSVRAGADGYACAPVPGAGPVHASLDSDGTLSVLSWEPDSRRLVLRERGPDGGLTRSMVTLCDNTDSVAMVRAGPSRALLYLFVEGRPRVAGGVGYQLSLLAPGSVLGKGGSRYRKAVLCAADGPITSFSAVASADALWVLVAREGVTLLRVGLSP